MVASLDFKPTGMIENPQVELDGLGRRRLNVSLPANVVGSTNAFLELNGKPVDFIIAANLTGDAENKRTLVQWKIPEDWPSSKYEAKVTINMADKAHDVHLINTSTIEIIE